jgi:hypothetical protein
MAHQAFTGFLNQREVDAFEESTGLARRFKLDDPFKSEAARKINAEMLQLDNQRFLLTTTAVVFVGAVAGWVTTALLNFVKTAGDGNGGAAKEILIRVGGIDFPLWHYLPPFAIILVGAILVFLFSYQASLAMTVRWLAAYQMSRGSDWEWTWYKLRELACRPNGVRELETGNDLPYAAFEKITTMFQLLIVISCSYFALLHMLLPGAVANSLLNYAMILEKGPGAWLALSLAPFSCSLLLALLFIPVLSHMAWRTKRIVECREHLFFKVWIQAEATWNPALVEPAPDAETMIRQPLRDEPAVNAVLPATQAASDD